MQYFLMETESQARIIVYFRQHIIVYVLHNIKIYNAISDSSTNFHHSCMLKHKFTFICIMKSAVRKVKREKGNL